MSNVYEAPKSNLVKESDNNSGQGKGTVPPEGIKSWSWGCFFLNWIWAIGNRTWIGVLAITPYVGFVMAIILGVKGREWAWQNKRWESVEHFQRVQKVWSFWGVLLVVGVGGLGILSAILIPMYVGYQNTGPY